MKYRFRDKLLLSFAGLLGVTFVPTLVLVNTQIETVSVQAIEQDLRSTKRVFERLQQTQRVSTSEKIANFILTQPIVRAEIATTTEAMESEFSQIFGSGDEDEDDDPFSDSGSSPEGQWAGNVVLPGAGGAAMAGSLIPERQSRLLSILEDVGLYRGSDVFFLTDFRGNLVFNKADPTLFNVTLLPLPAVFNALQGNEMFTWWGSRNEQLGSLGLLPAGGDQDVLYQMFIKPVRFRGEVRGLIAVGYAVTREDLQTITEITRSEIAFVFENHAYLNSSAVVGAETLLALPGDSAGLGVQRFDAGDDNYLALSVPVLSTAREPVGRVIVYRSKTLAQEAYQGLKTLLNIIGMISLLVAAALAFLVSRNVGGAVRELLAGVNEVRAGNLDYQIQVRARDEFGELGTAFNEMTVGLKEKEAIRATFKRYASSSVVDELLRDGGDVQLGGETRVLTVQFSDIAGFTGISEALSPERLVTFLNEYFSEVTEEIEAEQGVVDKFIGDAVMAFWGAPLALDNTALPACLAALRQLGKIRALQQRWAEDKALSQFNVRIGLHTGEVLVGNIGSRTRMDYTIMGDGVNTASRLEGMNKVYGTNILITESTQRLVQDTFITRELDLIRPVGKSLPVRIYELMALATAETPPLRERVERFAVALDLYRRQRFQEAMDAYALLDASLPDPPSRTFVSRCREFLADPPPEDWTGVFVPESK